MKKKISLVILTALVLGFASSASADLDCQQDTLSAKEPGDICNIGPATGGDISGQSLSAPGVTINVTDGGRIYTDHVTQSSPNDASISLGEGDFIVESGGAVHANINISAYNIKVEDGGVIDATGLGWQAPADNSPPCKFGSYSSNEKGDLCYGGGPAGGVSGTGNSNKGSGGGGHGGKGGSFENSNAYVHGGGYGPVNSDTYGNNGSEKEPTTFGSAGGAQKDTYTLSNVDGLSGHGNAADWTDERGDKILNATYGDGDQDDPDSDPLDSDRWISTDVEYRKNNPNDVRMSSGGGRIKLVASNKVNISGNLLANGLDGFGSEGSSGYSPGGGAGGSISIASGGIFGKGSVRVDGGTYMEKVDTQQDVFSGGGGGGRVYYAYSIKGTDWNWKVTADEGEGGVDLDTGWGGNSNGNLAKDEVATNGTIFSRIAFSANLNQSIVNPEEAIKINGTASSTVEIDIGSQTYTTEPDPDDGYYETVIPALNIQDTSNLGNYTLTVSSTISGNTISESFQVSHRTIDVQQNSGYILKPNEQFTVDANLDLIKEDGSGGINRTDYKNQPFTWGYDDADNTRVENSDTGSSAGFSFTDTVPTTRGLKYYQTNTENDNGIKGFDRKDLAWMDINTSIVDPGQQIKINGTSHSSVDIYLENQSNQFEYIDTASTEVDGYFEYNLTTLDIQDEEQIGNYTLRLETELNGQTRTETFEISHREIEIDNNPDFFLKANENLQFGNYTNLIKQDGEGGKTRVDYSNQNITYKYFNQSSLINQTNITTNNSGGYSVFQEIQPTSGKKRFTLETENKNQVNDLVTDDDLYNINNRSLAWADINTSIVDPGQQIKINGSAHNDVTLSLETPSGGFIDKGTYGIGSDGFFSIDIQSLTRSRIDSYEDLGNYTLKLETELNGQTRTETFEISHREVEFYHGTDYLLRPGESFSIDVYANRTLEDGSDGSRTEPYTYRDFQFIYFNGPNELRATTESTDDTGNSLITDEMAGSAGHKYYVIKHVNENGVNYLRSDNDLNDNSRKNLGMVSIDDYIVNSGEEIKVNGTAYNDVEIIFNGSEVTGSPVTPDPTTGFFNNTFTVPEIPDTSGLGNHTLRVNTTLNGKERSKIFDVSLRGIRFDLDFGYPRRVNPDENFTISGTATKYVEDDTGGSKTVDYSEETVTITYSDKNGEIQTKTGTTDSNGRFEIQDFESPSNAGDREIEISTVNDEGIKHDRTETVKTRIRVENSSTTSPSKRLFKDSNLDQTRFVNPNQDVNFEVKSRKSLDFVKRVYADVKLPDGTQKQVELNAQGVLGTELDSAGEWDEGNTDHLAHSDLLGELNSDRLRLGYAPRPEDELILDMPMESGSGDIKDISGRNNDATPSGSITRQVNGVYSTNSTEFSGGTLEIQDSSALNLASNFTISTWIKTSNVEGTVYSKASQYGQNMIPELRIESGKAQLEIANTGDWEKVTSTTYVSDGEWHHIAGKYNETHLSIFVDGKLETITDVGQDAKIEKLQKNPFIADTSQSKEDRFYGSIDQLRIFNQSLKEERIEKLGSQTGSIETSVIDTDKQVKDILKLVNFEGNLNNQEIQIETFSDPDDDGVFEESAEPINLSDGSDIRSVTGFGNYSDTFKLSMKFFTEDASESPLLTRIDFKARKDPIIKWQNSKSIEGFFGGQYGLYNVSYYAEDYGGNFHDTQPEESNFSVRDIEIEADHEEKVNPGNELDITGNVTIIEGDGSGGPQRDNFTGDLNVLFGDVLRGDNQINESRKFEELSTGETREIPVNGTETPVKTKITFLGQYSGVDELLRWNDSQDWDSYQSRYGMTHSEKEDSSLNNKSLTLGYSSKEVLGSPLKAYYAMDDSSLPLNDSVGENDFQTTGNPDIGTEGLVSTKAVELGGGDGFENTENLFSSTGAYAINTWINPDSLPDTGESYTMFAVENKLKLQITDAGAVYAETDVNGNTYTASTGSGVIEPGKWQMVSLVQDDDADGTLEVSTSKGLVDQNSGSVFAGEPADLTGKTSFVGTDSKGNGFDGRIDELRVYRGAPNPAELRDLAGDEAQQYLTTGEKQFSESINTRSLVLEADVEINGQRVSVQIKNGDGDLSDPIRLSDDQERYQVSDTMPGTQSYSLYVEMDSNRTHTPVIEDLSLIRRYATEDPAVDIDNDGVEDANYSGRITPSESITREIEGLSTGVNTASFSTANGAFDARVNYTEVLRNESADEVYTPVEVNESGEFSTSFTVPDVSGTAFIDYYTTNERGIQGINETEFSSGLLFTSSNVSDLANRDRVIDPDNSFQINASLTQSKNPIDRMWGEIETPTGNIIEKDLDNTTYSGKWNFTGELQPEIFDQEGNYTVQLHANDTAGLTELKSPEVSFNVTNGTVSVNKNKQVVGLERTFEVSGYVRQSLTGKKVNASVNVTLTETGVTKELDTNSSGFYNTTLQAPSTSGTYPVEVRSIDENAVTASNSTEIEVESSTNFELSVPEEKIQVLEVTLEEGVNKTFEINVTNQGDTEIRNLNVFAEALPKADEKEAILESSGGSNWKSVNRTYNISAGEKKQVEAEVWVSNASTQADYDLNISAEFETTGGDYRYSTRPITMTIKDSKIPVFQNNLSVTLEDGTEGNWAPPNLGGSGTDDYNMSIVNIGTGTAENIGWTVENSLFKEDWNVTFYNPRDGGYTKGTGDLIKIYEVNGLIPEGTPSGNYSTLLDVYSKDPQKTNKANLTVEVKDLPKFKIELLKLKDDVVIPEEINQSNPVDVGTMALDSKEDIFQLGLNNTGNRDLEWEVKSGLTTGDDDNLFYANESAIPNHGTATYNSTIKPLPNSRYEISSPSTSIGYTTRNSNELPESYSANISIQCVSPEGCTPQKVNIPVEGTIKNPPPKFSNIEVPEITGNGNSITINATVSDNKGTENTSGVADVNITVTKYLNETLTEKRSIPVSDLGVSGNIEETFDFTKNGWILDPKDHAYGIRFEAVDDEGNRRETKEYEVTVRDRGSLSFQFDEDPIPMENVTSDSGDTAYLRGNVTGGEVDVENVEITVVVDDSNIGDPENVNVPDTEKVVNVGDIDANETIDIERKIVSEAGIGDLPTYYTNIDTMITHPDGERLPGDNPPDDSTPDISIVPNSIMNITGTKNIEVEHNTTETGHINISSVGNTELSNIEFECIGCQHDLGITSYSDEGFNLLPGEERKIKFNVTAEKYLEQTTFKVHIKATSDEKTEYLNDTFFNVPNDRAVSITPLEAEEAVPINQGTANLTLFQIKNIGNDHIEPVSIANPIDGAVYLGTNPNENFETDMAPGDTEEFRLRADTDSLQTTIDYTGLKINPDSGTNLDEWDVAEVDLFAQDIGFEILDINSTDGIKAGDKISVEFNLTQEDKPINESIGADFRLKSEDKEIQLDSSYTENDTWEAIFQAPDIEDGVSHDFTFEARSDAYRSSVSTNTQVSYADVTSPKFINLTAEPVTQNNASTISVKLKDNSDIPEGDVTATIQTPSETIQQKLNNQSSEDLSEMDQKEWALEFTNTSERGRYNVTITASDMPGNTGTSDFKIFRVFEPLNVEGDAVDPSEETKIELVNAGGEVTETIDPVNDTYNQTIKSGTYERADIQVDDDKVATVESIEASSINQSPPRFDADIDDDFVQVDEKYLKGYALESETFENVSGSTGFSYSDVVGEIDFQGNLQVLKCDDYNVSSVTPCESGYEPLPSDDIGIDSETQTVAVEEIDGFSSYILVENTTSSEQNNLNVNLTGELGDLGQLSNLSSVLDEVASNTEGISDLDGGTGGTEGSTESSGTSAGGALDEIASQLNESEDELAVGNSKISISIQPGQQKSTAISIQNPKSEPIDIELQSTDNIVDMVSYEDSFNLSAGEFRTVRISVDASNKTELKEYSGFIQIKGADADRSIPVNIEIVGAENRLLDVSLEPTVDNFRPGKTARLKLSFSNQGFSRAVDAETTVEIVDITDDKVIAKKTHTYAVQTTLDKVVSLSIPEDTELGTYEARASVEYSNIPGNRSATAVGQVQVERPFWQRQTLGLANIYWLGLLLLLIAAVSGGGYWYYRKKKLEAKRKRFEEQVDNDAIPSEAGRTAFVGQLSEIGTRAFINLDDLMTHCLTAGATGAGKSVAAQVMVEEALEQGINVIVLDPTGQWSGYLDENKDEQFFAFYDDFGMKENDARSYEGNIRAVDADQDTIDITDIIRPEEDEGSIHVFSMHKLENKDLEEYLSDTIQQIFDYNPEEKDHLETLIVYDEAHRVLEKFGGTGRGAKKLERGAREFRKWGIGMLVISQVIEDFPEEVRANIGTQIQMRTEYEGDLDRIERKYGKNITQGVTKADTGTGMLQNSSYNHGRPYFVDFRPIKHSPERLSDEELDKFEKYNRRVDELEDMISILEDQGEDVFEYESQLKLVKKNIRKRSFNLVDTYLDELEEDLNEALDL